MATDSSNPNMRLVSRPEAGGRGGAGGGSDDAASTIVDMLPHRSTTYIPLAVPQAPVHRGGPVTVQEVRDGEKALAAVDLCGLTAEGLFALAYLPYATAMQHARDVATGSASTTDTAVWAAANERRSAEAAHNRLNRGAPIAGSVLLPVPPDAEASPSAEALQRYVLGTALSYGASTIGRPEAAEVFHFAMDELFALVGRQKGAADGKQSQATAGNNGNGSAGASTTAGAQSSSAPNAGGVSSATANGPTSDDRNGSSPFSGTFGGPLFDEDAEAEAAAERAAGARHRSSFFDATHTIGAGMLGMEEQVLVTMLLLGGGSGGGVGVPSSLAHQQGQGAPLLLSATNAGAVQPSDISVLQLRAAVRAVLGAKLNGGLSAGALFAGAGAQMGFGMDLAMGFGQQSLMGLMGGGGSGAFGNIHHQLQRGSSFSAAPCRYFSTSFIAQLLGLLRRFLLAQGVAVSVDAAAASNVPPPLPLPLNTIGFVVVTILARRSLPEVLALLPILEGLQSYARRRDAFVRKGKKKGTGGANYTSIANAEEATVSTERAPAFDAIVSNALATFTIRPSAADRAALAATNVSAGTNGGGPLLTTAAGAIIDGVCHDAAPLKVPLTEGTVVHTFCVSRDRRFVATATNEGLSIYDLVAQRFIHKGGSVGGHQQQQQQHASITPAPSGEDAGEGSSTSSTSQLRDAAAAAAGLANGGGHAAMGAGGSDDLNGSQPLPSSGAASANASTNGNAPNLPRSAAPKPTPAWALHFSADASELLISDPSCRTHTRLATSTLEVLGTCEVESACYALFIDDDDEDTDVATSGSDDEAGPRQRDSCGILGGDKWTRTLARLRPAAEEARGGAALYATVEGGLYSDGNDDDDEGRRRNSRPQSAHPSQRARSATTSTAIGLGMPNGSSRRSRGASSPLRGSSTESVGGNNLSLTPDMRDTATSSAAVSAAFLPSPSTVVAGGAASAGSRRFTAARGSSSPTHRQSASAAASSTRGGGRRRGSSSSCGEQQRAHSLPQGDDNYTNPSNEEFLHRINAGRSDGPAMSSDNIMCSPLPLGTNNGNSSAGRRRRRRQEGRRYSGGSSMRGSGGGRFALFEAPLLPYGRLHEATLFCAAADTSAINMGSKATVLSSAAVSLTAGAGRTPAIVNADSLRVAAYVHEDFLGTIASFEGLTTGDEAIAIFIVDNVIHCTQGQASSIATLPRIAGHPWRFVCASWEAGTFSVLVNGCTIPLLRGHTSPTRRVSCKTVHMLACCGHIANVAVWTGPLRLATLHALAHYKAFAYPKGHTACISTETATLMNNAAADGGPLSADGFGHQSPLSGDYYSYGDAIRRGNDTLSSPSRSTNSASAATAPYHQQQQRQRMLAEEDDGLGIGPNRITPIAHLPLDEASGIWLKELVSQTAHVMLSSSGWDTSEVLPDVMEGAGGESEASRRPLPPTYAVLKGSLWPHHFPSLPTNGAVRPAFSPEEEAEVVAVAASRQFAPPTHQPRHHRHSHHHSHGHGRRHGSTHARVSRGDAEDAAVDEMFDALNEASSSSTSSSSPSMDGEGSYSDGSSGSEASVGNASSSRSPSAAAAAADNGRNTRNGRENNNDDSDGENGRNVSARSGEQSRTRRRRRHIGAAASHNADTPARSDLPTTAQRQPTASFHYPSDLADDNYSEDDQEEDRQRCKAPAVTPFVAPHNVRLPAAILLGSRLVHSRHQTVLVAPMARPGSDMLLTLARGANVIEHIAFTPHSADTAVFLDYEEAYCYAYQQRYCAFSCARARTVYRGALTLRRWADAAARLGYRSCAVGEDGDDDEVAVTKQEEASAAANDTSDQPTEAAAAPPPRGSGHRDQTHDDSLAPRLTLPRLIEGIYTVLAIEAFEIERAPRHLTAVSAQSLAAVADGLRRCGRRTPFVKVLAMLRLAMAHFYAAAAASERESTAFARRISPACKALMLIFPSGPLFAAASALFRLCVRVSQSPLQKAEILCCATDGQNKAIVVGYLALPSACEIVFSILPRSPAKALRMLESLLRACCREAGCDWDGAVVATAANATTIGNGVAPNTPQSGGEGSSPAAAAGGTPALNGSTTGGAAEHSSLNNTFAGLPAAATADNTATPPSSGHAAPDPAAPAAVGQWEDADAAGKGGRGTSGHPHAGGGKRQRGAREAEGETITQHMLWFVLAFAACALQGGHTAALGEAVRLALHATRRIVAAAGGVWAEGLQRSAVQTVLLPLLHIVSSRCPEVLAGDNADGKEAPHCNGSGVTLVDEMLRLFADVEGAQSALFSLQQQQQRAGTAPNNGALPLFGVQATPNGGTASSAAAAAVVSGGDLLLDSLTFNAAMGGGEGAQRPPSQPPGGSSVTSGNSPLMSAHPNDPSVAAGSTVAGGSGYLNETIEGPPSTDDESATTAAAATAAAIAHNPSASMLGMGSTASNTPDGHRQQHHQIVERPAGTTPSAHLYHYHHHTPGGAVPSSGGGLLPTPLLPPPHTHVNYQQQQQQAAAAAAVKWSEVAFSSRQAIDVRPPNSSSGGSSSSSGGEWSITLDCTQCAAVSLAREGAGELSIVCVRPSGEPQIRRLLPREPSIKFPHGGTLFVTGLGPASLTLVRQFSFRIDTSWVGIVRSLVRRAVVAVAHHMLAVPAGVEYGLAPVCRGGLNATARARLGVPPSHGVGSSNTTNAAATAPHQPPPASGSSNIAACVNMPNSGNGNAAAATTQRPSRSMRRDPSQIMSDDDNIDAGENANGSNGAAPLPTSNVSNTNNKSAAAAGAGAADSTFAQDVLFGRGEGKAFADEVLLAMRSSVTANMRPALVGMLAVLLHCGYSQHEAEEELKVRWFGGEWATKLQGEDKALSLRGVVELTHWIVCNTNGGPLPCSPSEAAAAYAAAGGGCGGGVGGSAMHDSFRGGGASHSLAHSQSHPNGSSNGNPTPTSQQHRSRRASEMLGNSSSTAGADGAAVGRRHSVGRRAHRMGGAGGGGNGVGGGGGGASSLDVMEHISVLFTKGVTARQLEECLVRRTVRAQSSTAALGLLDRLLGVSSDRATTAAVLRCLMQVPLGPTQHYTDPFVGCGVGLEYALRGGFHSVLRSCLAALRGRWAHGVGLSAASGRLSFATPHFAQPAFNAKQRLAGSAPDGHGVLGLLGLLVQNWDAVDCDILCGWDPSTIASSNIGGGANAPSSVPKPATETAPTATAPSQREEDTPQLAPSSLSATPSPPLQAGAPTAAFAATATDAIAIDSSSSAGGSRVEVVEFLHMILQTVSASTPLAPSSALGQGLSSFFASPTSNTNNAAVNPAAAAAGRGAMNHRHSSDASDERRSTSPLDTNDAFDAQPLAGNPHPTATATATATAVGAAYLSPAPRIGEGMQSTPASATVAPMPPSPGSTAAPLGGGGTQLHSSSSYLMLAAATSGVGAGGPTSSFLGAGSPPFPPFPHAFTFTRDHPPLHHPAEHAHLLAAADIGSASRVMPNSFRVALPKIGFSILRNDRGFIVERTYTQPPASGPDTAAAAVLRTEDGWPVGSSSSASSSSEHRQHLMGMPRVFYFEVTVGEGLAQVGIGLTGGYSNEAMTVYDAFDLDASGQLVCHGAPEARQLPAFSDGDTVGCGFIPSVRRAFFTLNGLFLGFFELRPLSTPLASSATANASARGSAVMGAANTNGSSANPDPDVLYPTITRMVAVEGPPGALAGQQNPPGGAGRLLVNLGTSPFRFDYRRLHPMLHPLMAGDMLLAGTSSSAVADSRCGVGGTCSFGEAPDSAALLHHQRQYGGFFGGTPTPLLPHITNTSFSVTAASPRHAYLQQHPHLMAAPHANGTLPSPSWHIVGNAAAHALQYLASRCAHLHAQQCAAHRIAVGGVGAGQGSRGAGAATLITSTGGGACAVASVNGGGGNGIGSAATAMLRHISRAATAEAIGISRELLRSCGVPFPSAHWAAVWAALHQKPQSANEHHHQHQSASDVCGRGVMSTTDGVADDPASLNVSGNGANRGASAATTLLPLTPHAHPSAGGPVSTAATPPSISPFLGTVGNANILQHFGGFTPEGADDLIAEGSVLRGGGVSSAASAVGAAGLAATMGTSVGSVLAEHTTASPNNDDTLLSAMLVGSIGGVSSTAVGAGNAIGLVPSDVATPAGLGVGLLPAGGASSAAVGGGVLPRTIDISGAYASMGGSSIYSVTAAAVPLGTANALAAACLETMLLNCLSITRKVLAAAPTYATVNLVAAPSSAAAGAIVPWASSTAAPPTVSNSSNSNAIVVHTNGSSNQQREAESVAIGRSFFALLTHLLYVPMDTVRLAALRLVPPALPLLAAPTFVSDSAAEALVGPIYELARQKDPLAPIPFVPMWSRCEVRNVSLVNSTFAKMNAGAQRSIVTGNVLPRFGTVSFSVRIARERMTSGHSLKGGYFIGVSIATLAPLSPTNNSQSWKLIKPPVVWALHDTSPQLTHAVNPTVPPNNFQRTFGSFDLITVVVNRDKGTVAFYRNGDFLKELYNDLPSDVDISPFVQMYNDDASATIYPGEITPSVTAPGVASAVAVDGLRAMLTLRPFEAAVAAKLRAEMAAERLPSVTLSVFGSLPDPRSQVYLRIPSDETAVVVRAVSGTRMKFSIGDTYYYDNAQHLRLPPNPTIRGPPAIGHHLSALASASSALSHNGVGGNGAVSITGICSVVGALTDSLNRIALPLVCEAAVASLEARHRQLLVQEENDTRVALHSGDRVRLFKALHAEGLQLKIPYDPTVAPATRYAFSAPLSHPGFVFPPSYCSRLATVPTGSAFTETPFIALAEPAIPSTGRFSIRCQLIRGHHGQILGGGYYFGVCLPSVLRRRRDMNVSPPDVWALHDMDDAFWRLKHLVPDRRLPVASDPNCVLVSGDIIRLEIDRTERTMAAFRQPANASDEISLGIIFDSLPKEGDLYPFVHLYNCDAVAILLPSTPRTPLVRTTTQQQRMAPALSERMRSCDGCISQHRDTRLVQPNWYKCNECADYNLCHSCFYLYVHNGHTFTQMDPDALLYSAAPPESLRPGQRVVVAGAPVEFLSSNACSIDSRRFNNLAIAKADDAHALWGLSAGAAPTFTVTVEPNAKAEAFPFNRPVFVGIAPVDFAVKCTTEALRNACLANANAGDDAASASSSPTAAAVAALTGGASSASPTETLDDTGDSSSVNGSGAAGAFVPMVISHCSDSRIRPKLDRIALRPYGFQRGSTITMTVSYADRTVLVYRDWTLLGTIPLPSSPAYAHGAPLAGFVIFSSQGSRASVDAPLAVTRNLTISRPLSRQLAIATVDGCAMSRVVNINNCRALLRPLTAERALALVAEQEEVDREKRAAAEKGGAVEMGEGNALASFSPHSFVSDASSSAGGASSPTSASLPAAGTAALGPSAVANSRHLLAITERGIVPCKLAPPNAKDPNPLVHGASSSPPSSPLSLSTAAGATLRVRISGAHSAVSQAVPISNLFLSAVRVERDTLVAVRGSGGLGMSVAGAGGHARLGASSNAGIGLLSASAASGTASEALGGSLSGAGGGGVGSSSAAAGATFGDGFVISRIILTLVALLDEDVLFAEVGRHVERLMTLIAQLASVPVPNDAPFSYLKDMRDGIASTARLVRSAMHDRPLGPLIPDVHFEAERASAAEGTLLAVVAGPLMGCVVRVASSSATAIINGGLHSSPDRRYGKPTDGPPLVRGVVVYRPNDPFINRAEAARQQQQRKQQQKQIDAHAAAMPDSAAESKPTADATTDAIVNSTAIMNAIANASTTSSSNGSANGLLRVGAGGDDANLSRDDIGVSTNALNTPSAALLLGGTANPNPTPDVSVAVPSTSHSPNARNVQSNVVATPARQTPSSEVGCGAKEGEEEEGGDGDIVTIDLRQCVPSQQCGSLPWWNVSDGLAASYLEHAVRENVPDAELSRAHLVRVFLDGEWHGEFATEGGSASASSAASTTIVALSLRYVDDAVVGTATVSSDAARGPVSCLVAGRYHRYQRRVNLTITYDPLASADACRAAAARHGLAWEEESDAGSSAPTTASASVVERMAARVRHAARNVQSATATPPSAVTPNSSGPASPAAATGGPVIIGSRGRGNSSSGRPPTPPSTPLAEVYGKVTFTLTGYMDAEGMKMQGSWRCAGPSAAIAAAFTGTATNTTAGGGSSSASLLLPTGGLKGSFNFTSLRGISISKHHSRALRTVPPLGDLEEPPTAAAGAQSAGATLRRLAVLLSRHLLVLFVTRCPDNAHARRYKREVIRYHAHPMTRRFIAAQRTTTSGGGATAATPLSAANLQAVATATAAADGAIAPLPSAHAGDESSMAAVSEDDDFTGIADAVALIKAPSSRPWDLPTLAKIITMSLRLRAGAAPKVPAVYWDSLHALVSAAHACGQAYRSDILGSLIDLVQLMPPSDTLVDALGALFAWIDKHTQNPLVRLTQRDVSVGIELVMAIPQRRLPCAFGALPMPAFRALIEIARCIKYGRALPRVMDKLGRLAERPPEVSVRCPFGTFADGELKVGKIVSVQRLRVGGAGGRYYFEVGLPERHLGTYAIGWGTIAHQDIPSQHVGSDVHSFAFCGNQVLSKGFKEEYRLTTEPLHGSTIGALLDLSERTVAWSVNGTVGRLMPIPIRDVTDETELCAFVSTGNCGGLRINMTATDFANCPDGYVDLNGSTLRAQIHPFTTDERSVAPPRPLPFYEKVAAYVAAKAAMDAADAKAGGGGGANANPLPSDGGARGGGVGGGSSMFGSGSSAAGLHHGHAVAPDPALPSAAAAGTPLAVAVTGTQHLDPYLTTPAGNGVGAGSSSTAADGSQLLAASNGAPPSSSSQGLSQQQQHASSGGGGRRPMVTFRTPNPAHEALLQAHGLATVPSGDLAAYCSHVRVIESCLTTAFRYVDLDTEAGPHGSGMLSAAFRYLRPVAPPTLRKKMAEIPPLDRSEVTLSTVAVRSGDTAPPGPRSTEAALQMTAVGQLYKQFGSVFATNSAQILGQATMFKVSLYLSGSQHTPQDMGGPYRQLWTLLADELMRHPDNCYPHTDLHRNPLFRFINNSKRVAIVPDSDRSTAHDEALFFFLGQLMGHMARARTPLALDVSAYVWKFLVEQPLTVRDYYDDVDSVVEQSMGEDDFFTMEIADDVVPGYADALAAIAAGTATVDFYLTPDAFRDDPLAPRVRPRAAVGSKGPAALAADADDDTDDEASYSYYGATTAAAAASASCHSADGSSAGSIPAISSLRGARRSSPPTAALRSTTSANGSCAANNSGDNRLNAANSAAAAATTAAPLQPQRPAAASVGAGFGSDSDEEALASITGPQSLLSLGGPIDPTTPSANATGSAVGTGRAALASASAATAAEAEAREDSSVLDALPVATMRAVAEHCLVHSMDQQLGALRSGLWSVLPRKATRCMGWADLETAVCGDAAPSMEKIRESLTVLLHPMREAFFWRIVEEMSGEQRAALLCFASGQRRLPLVKKIRVAESAESLGHLPRAQSCSSLMVMPMYTSFESMRHKLLTAIAHSGEMELA